MNSSYSKTKKTSRTRKEKARLGRFLDVKIQDTKLQVEFDDNKLLPLLFGEHNVHLVSVENKLDVVLYTRGNTLVISGPKDQVKVAHKVITNLYAQAKNGREIDSADVDGVLRMASLNANSKVLESINTATIKTQKRNISPRS